MSAVTQLVTKHLDLWTSAIKRRSAAGRGSSSKTELYGIRKLRGLILELAVHGLLVPQDPNDEPASELLKKIATEKATLAKRGRSNKEKPLVQVDDEESPHPLPKGWLWERFGNLAEHNAGKTLDNGRNQGIPRDYITTSNLYWGFFDLSDAKQMPIQDSDLKKCLATKNDLLICEGGEAGRAAVWSFDYDICFQNHIHRARFWQGISPYYACRLLEKMSYSGEIDNYRKGVGISNMSGKALGSIPFPLPPLAEQHRIAAKVDELMALCDQLEQQTEASLAVHQTLVETLLNAMTSVASHEQFANAWQRIAKHFDTLFTTEQSIDQLKQSIRQLAMMGKLVPQNPNDEPASELLKKIASEKARLVKERKIKNHPPVDPIENSQILPDTWVEIFVQDFADIRLGSTPSRAEPKFWNGNIPWVSSGEVANRIIRNTYENITQEGFENSSTSIIPARSLLMAIIGQGKTRGQTALLEIDACTNQNVAAFVFNEQFVSPEYAWIWAKSKYESHRDDGHGGAQPALNGKKVRSFKFPLAPIQEQYRIVTKVEELLGLCDQLKAFLNEAQTTRLHLADAMAEQALMR